MGKFLKNQIGFLITGIAFWFPILVLIMVLVFLYNNLDDIGKRFLLLYLPEELVFSGFGLILVILLIYLSGIVLKIKKVRRFLSRIPVLGILFKEGEVITFERLLNLSPCMFMLSPTCLSYGWILSEENVLIDDKKAEFTIINVYYPNVPTILTGQVFPVRKDTVIKLGNPSKEVIDLLLYSFRSPNNIKYLPWEDETPADFEKRAVSFGININKEIKCK
jgi:uncharacterized membrane protein